MLPDRVFPATPFSRHYPMPRKTPSRRSGKRHIVCLTFDFDAISGFIARGQTSPSWISRGEYGPRVGMPRLIALLKKYRIKSTWFIPGHTIETYPRECETVMRAGHEIAHHGWTHRPPASLTREQEEAELARANECIKKL